MEKQDPGQTVCFAPDYGCEIDPYVVEAALRILSAPQIDVLGLSDREGRLAATVDISVLRGMILHGLVEIFDRRLTPLGLAVREITFERK